jgi:UPF0755 protein
VNDLPSTDAVSHEPPAPDEADVPDASSRHARRAARAHSVRHRRRLLLVLVVLGVLAAPFLVAGGWFWWQLDPPGGSGGRVTVDIPSGTGVHGIGDRLHAAGVIGSSLAFRAYVEISGGGPYRAGRYQLRHHMGVRAAADQLAKGPSVLRLALPPGLNLDQIAARVGQLPGLRADRFLAVANSGRIRSKYEPPGVNTLEGLTFPDTYLVERGETETDVLRTLVSSFDAMGDRIGLSRATAEGLTPYQAVIEASMIQGEAKLDVDRPLIAAVIDNRLRGDMLLQIDATVRYARGPDHPGPLTSADFKLGSPYNTYVVKGLPPTPIMTVSEASLRAALAPANVDYLYYVVIDKSGKHAFATTYQQHLANIAEARKKGVL